MPDAPSWFRLYRSILNNPKIQSLPLAKFGAWVKLLALADPKTGIVDLSTYAKRAILGQGYATNPNRCSSLLDYLYKRLLLDKLPDNTFRIHNWDSRQWLRVSGDDKLSKNCMPQMQSDNYQIGENSTDVSTDCCTKLLSTFQVSKEVTGFKDTEKPATEQNIRIYIGAQGFFSRYKSYCEILLGKNNKIRDIDSNSNKAPGTGNLFMDDLRAGDDEQGIAGAGSFPAAGESVFVRQANHYQKEIQAIFGHWQSVSGVIRHQNFTLLDYEACKQCLIAHKSPKSVNGLSDACEVIKRAISHYSQHITGSKTGKYRQVYKWTFREFITRNHHGLIGRYAADQWEETAEPFDCYQARKPVRHTVAHLLEQAEKIQNPDLKPETDQKMRSGRDLDAVPSGGGVKVGSPLSAAASKTKGPLPNRR